MAESKETPASGGALFIGATVAAALAGIWVLDQLLRSEGAGAEFAVRAADEELATRALEDGDSLREIAVMEGNAFVECDPSDPRWSWSWQPFAVTRVIDRPLVGGAMSREDWAKWLSDEISAGIRGGAPYMDALARALHGGLDEPVVVAVHPDGRAEIGDGWHRLAIAVRDGIAYLPAVVGRRKGVL